MNDTKPIDKFRGDHLFLSNFYLIKVHFMGIDFPSSENAYQAAKCKHPKDREKFIKISAGEAKKLGQNIEIRKDWELVKLDIMEKVLKEKFSNPRLKYLLKLTKDSELIEGNWWGDRYWGVYHGEGENNLGKLLMKIRSDIND